MILRIKDALDTIKPDEKLVSQTEQLLRNKMQTEKPNFRFTPAFSRLSLAACLFLIVGTMSISAYSYYQRPVNYLDIDINPSLELGINRLERVVEVNYFNKDAENLVDEDALRGCKPEEAVSLVLDAAKSSGYISQGEVSIVSLAAIGSKEETSYSILEKCAAAIKSDYEDVAVYSSTVSSDFKKEADMASISAGKLKLIKMVQSLDEDASVDDYRDKSVTDIFNKLSSLISSSYKEAPGNKKSSVLTGIDDVNTQMKNIEDKLNRECEKSELQQNDANDEKHSGNKSENKTGAQKPASNSDSASENYDKDKPSTPNKPQDDSTSFIDDSPAAGQTQTDEQEKPDLPDQNIDPSHVGEKPPAGNHPESGS